MMENCLVHPGRCFFIFFYLFFADRAVSKKKKKSWLKSCDLNIFMLVEGRLMVWMPIGGVGALRKRRTTISARIFHTSWTSTGWQWTSVIWKLPVVGLLSANVYAIVERNLAEKANLCAILWTTNFILRINVALNLKYYRLFLARGGSFNSSFWWKKVSYSTLDVRKHIAFTGLKRNRQFIS